MSLAQVRFLQRRPTLRPKQIRPWVAAWGVRKVWATLRREHELRVSKKRLWAIMKANGLVLARDSEPGEPTRGHVAMPEPNRRLAADFTTAWTKLDGVITTRYQRTRLTAAPVVKAQQLEPVEVAASRDITAHAAEVASLVNAMPAGSAVLIVGHSNTLAPIIAALGGPAIPELCDGQYDAHFFLDRGGTAPRLVRGHYGAPDAPGADGCHASPAP